MALMLLSGSHLVAGFSSLYMFGDGVTNTNEPPAGGGADYYGNRYCNGKVFIEVLAGWQGVTFENAKNNSYFGHDSAALIQSVQNLPPPSDAATALFIVWNNDADYVNEILENIDFPFGSLTPWNELKARSLANHQTAIQALYNKGARNIIMPLAVNVMSVPAFNETSVNDIQFARQRIIEYNTEFKSTMSGLMADNPGLNIIMPDTFAFFETVLANPAAFDMINPLPDNAGGLLKPDSPLNGPGAQYVFWDDYHPSAKFQMHLAAFIQQMISPVKINSVLRVGADVHLQLANIPLGSSGMIQGSSTLQPPWTTDVAVDEPFSPGGNTTKTFVFPASGPQRFYRAAFPVVWTWP